MLLSDKVSFYLNKYYELIYSWLGRKAKIFRFALIETRCKECPTIFVFIGTVIRNKHVYNITSCFEMHNASVPVRCIKMDWLNWKTVIWKYIRSWPLCIVILTRSQVQLSFTIVVGMNRFCRDIAVLFITLMRHV